MYFVVEHFFYFANNLNSTHIPILSQIENLKNLLFLQLLVLYNIRLYYLITTPSELERIQIYLKFRSWLSLAAKVFPSYYSTFIAQRYTPETQSFCSVLPVVVAPLPLVWRRLLSCAPCTCAGTCGVEL